MRIAFQELLKQAFHAASSDNVNAALEAARHKLEAERHAGAAAFEVVVPGRVDLSWFTSMLHRLVYHCESTGARLPGCGGVFVAFHHGDRLFCVRAADVVRFGCAALQLTPAQLVQMAGTGEIHSAMRQS